ncbi:peptide ABC transporter substrate-binding protein [Candidatus Kaiserbacteria bacterium]|nr:peptide ABC transporter substrate-binding protein [Candidatus Kaiserbacteria bacterium]
MEMDQYSDIEHTQPSSEIARQRERSEASRLPVGAAEMRNTFLRFRKAKLLAHIESLWERFSEGERMLLYILTLLLALSTLMILAGLNKTVSVQVPTRGGSITEGETGPARFVNPLIALSRADQDLSELVYSGLTRARPDGSYVPDLADHFDISADGTVYTFTLRSGARFHNGSPVTSADVLFTIALAQNPDIKSTHRADWEGVSVAAPDAHTIVFTLPHAYAPFIDNTTLGILPKALWEKVSPQEFPFASLNTHPVGSGPFEVAKVTTDSTGAATRYDLAPFDQFTLGEPYLSRISLLFFPNQDTVLKAFSNGQIDALAGVMPSDLLSLARKNENVVTSALPRVFGIFFNQNHLSALTDSSVRKALDASIDKHALVESVLGGFASTLDGPVPPGILGPLVSKKPASSLLIAARVGTSTPDSGAYVDNARAILFKSGWSFSTSTNAWTKKSGKGKSISGGNTTLSLKLATADEPELVATAERIVQDWRAAGIQVSLQIYPLSEFNATALRPRDYDAILFGEVVGRSADLFAFWHSSQRNDPGLNLALYANSKADALLSQARATTNKSERDSLYARFNDLVKEDVPAVFLYAPQFVYLVPANVQGIELGALTTPSERFLNAYTWYSDTERVWSFFSNKSE